MNVQHKLCEAMKETEGPKGGTENTLRYAGRLWFAQGARHRDEPLTGLVPKLGSLLTQQMSRADLAAELSVFFFFFCFKEKLPALELHQPSHYPHL